MNPKRIKVTQILLVTTISLRRSRKLLVANHVHDLAHLAFPRNIDSRALRVKGTVGIVVCVCFCLVFFGLRV